MATPRIPLPLNHVGVNLWYVDLAWSPGLMKVGFVTSLSGTVQWIDTIATCYDYTYVQLDFTDQNIADTGYLVFSYDNTSGAGTGLIDDLTILQFSSCSPVDNLHVAELSNTEATVAWSESDSDSYALGYWCYIADTDSRTAAFDSVYLPSGSSSHTFSSLQGNRQYYVWVVSFCSSEPGMTATCSFVTYPDCRTVQNLRSHCGYRQMELDWDAPAGGEEATEYLVSYRPASDTHWTTAVATEDFFFLTDLAPDTRYFYRVRSVCSDSVSLAVEGSAYTLGCSATVIPPTGVHSNLPVAYGSYNSYTQQIYLSSEMTGIDTIVGLTFFLSDNYIIDTALVVVYLANTSKSRFNSGHDYVPASALTEVFDGVVFNNGREVSIHFATPFVREADSNLVVAINKSMDDYATVVPSFVVGSATLRSMYSTGIGSISPSSPSYGTRLNYVNTIRFGTWGCGLPYDTVFVHDTTYITREVHDTMFINNYVHDTVWMTNYVYDTVYINNTIHDTAYITQYVHDTTFVNNYVHDTAFIYQYIHDTIYLYRYIYDTVYIHDTIYIQEGEGIDNIALLNAKIYQRNGQIVVEGAEGHPVCLYDVVGRLLATKRETAQEVLLDVPVSGAYLVKIGDAPARRVVVRR